MDAFVASSSSIKKTNHYKYPKSRYWMVTINFTIEGMKNHQTQVWDDENEDYEFGHLTDIGDHIPKCTFWMYQLEKVSHLHVQGYLEFSEQVRMSHILKHWGWYVKPHLEPRKGTQEQAMLYCRKNESYYGSISDPLDSIDDEDVILYGRIPSNFMINNHIPGKDQKGQKGTNCPRGGNCMYCIRMRH